MHRRQVSRPPGQVEVVVDVIPASEASRSALALVDAMLDDDEPART
jgi:hypothetical protein